MKQSLLIPFLFMLILTSCKKEDPIEPRPGRMLNIAPRAFARGNSYVVLPADSATLDGAFDDAPFDVVGQGWRKISGPASCLIENPGMLQTKLRDLVRGTYEFELTVIDKGGLTGMDTLTVEVLDAIIPGSSELTFKNLQWIFPWYAAIEVKNIYQYVAPKKVFIQRGFDATWIEVNYLSSDPNNSTYEYFIEKRLYGAGMYDYGSLYIFYYGTLTNDNPQVKIQF
jgi:hypothetical protein